ncbi:hypothetical protein ACFY7C_24910 [Streptomyces sp. NPDC012769]|uniref:hypothetical protein n=1 Tax=Streptomyces sp. NPDC012769 TaxID=3364848 RepID=UPI003699EE35
MTTVGRRALLTAGAAVTLAGCTSGGNDGPRKPDAAERAARAEAALRARSANTSRDLLLRYDAVISGHPALAARLAPLRASVAAHVKALGEGGTARAPGSSASDSPSGAPSPSHSLAFIRVPGDPEAALKTLASAVRATADTHAAALLTAPPEYARLLASVAASVAAHAYLLTAPTEGGRG